ncbi:hypothetical protein REPUB_Repub04eG0026700 [Reevesia pubescens]
MGTKESYWIYEYFGKWRFLITLRRSLSLCKSQGKNEEFKFVIIYLIIALVYLGAHKQWSLLSTTSGVALGLLHIIGFAFIAYYLNDVEQRTFCEFHPPYCGACINKWLVVLPAPYMLVTYRWISKNGRLKTFSTSWPLILKASNNLLLRHYGRILDIELKLPPRPPGYCFVEFEDPLDAEDAIKGRDGYNFDGCRIRVELAHGGRGQSSRRGYGGYGGGGGGGGGRFGVSHRSEFRVVVRGLPSSASWQDLKDHMRKAGDVCFAEVYRDGDEAMGLVDYTNYDDMKCAIRQLDDSEFRNPFARAYIRVKCYEGSPRGSRSRSRSRSGSPRSNRRSVSKPRSPSPARLSRSRSRSN